MTTKVLVLGANGQLARNTIPFLLRNPDLVLTLYLRRANRLANPDPSRVTIVEGDVLDQERLRTAIRGQDVVFASLTAAMAQQAQAITYRDSAALIEQSDLDYTILRPGWFTHDEAVNYRLTQTGEAFVGHDVSLNSLSDLIAKLAASPVLYARCSVGVSGSRTA